jgi:hypothetical protein
VLGLNRATRRWIFRDIDMPKFTKLISCDRLEDSTVACFLADDGRSYVAEFSHDVCQALLRELQTAAIGQTQELLALTITGHAAAVGVGADGKALVIRTREIGTIALPMDDARISSIRTSLAELLSMLTSIRKN